MKPGDPNCPKCHGEGVVPYVDEDLPVPLRGKHPPSYRRCTCVLHKDILVNVERGMRGLSKAPKVESSPLIEFMDKDLWITAPKGWFKAHLRHVAVRQPPSWYFKVITDADLMSAWLASASAKGAEILDIDVSQTTLTHITLEDLVIPPKLLILRTGVKHARNVAAPEVFLEALQLREAADLPTWVWDTPTMMLAEGHIDWSYDVQDFLSTYPHKRVQPEADIKSKGSKVSSPGGFKDMSLSSNATGSPTVLSSGSGRKTLRGRKKK